MSSYILRQSLLLIFEFAVSLSLPSQLTETSVSIRLLGLQAGMGSGSLNLDHLA